jgi:hypothetical protein
VQYTYVRTRVPLRNPGLEEGAVLVNVEYWRFQASMRFPPTRETPACDAMLRARSSAALTLTRFLLTH